jgi:hypothetical protein
MSFEKDYYAVVRNFLPKELVEYVQYSCDIHETIYLNKKPPTEDDPFPYGDPQSPESFSWYGAIHTEALLLYCGQRLSKITGKELSETYSYTRAYYKGAELKRHVDRHSCEYSGTICISKNGADWPIYFENLEGNVLECELEPGDLAVYKGAEIPHWRKTYTGDRHVQIFVHYVDKNGLYGDSHLYDGRPFLGAPYHIKIRSNSSDTWKDQSENLLFQARG